MPLETFTFASIMKCYRKINYCVNVGRRLILELSPSLPFFAFFRRWDENGRQHNSTLTFVSLSTFRWPSLNCHRTNGSENATDYLVRANNRLMSSLSVFFLVQTSFLKIPDAWRFRFYWNHTFILEFVLFVLEIPFVSYLPILRWKMYANCNWTIRMTITNYTLGRKKKRTSKNWRSLSPLPGMACCENTNETIMDIDPLLKRKSHWENIAKNWHCSRNETHHKQTEQHTKESRERERDGGKRIYICLIIISNVLYVCSLSLHYICYKPFVSFATIWYEVKRCCRHSVDQHQRPLAGAVMLLLLPLRKWSKSPEQ